MCKILPVVLVTLFFPGTLFYLQSLHPNQHKQIFQMRWRINQRTKQIPYQADDDYDDNCDIVLSDPNNLISTEVIWLQNNIILSSQFQYLELPILMLKMNLVLILSSPGIFTVSIFCIFPQLFLQPGLHFFLHLGLGP